VLEPKVRDGSMAGLTYLCMPVQVVPLLCKSWRLHGKYKKPRRVLFMRFARLCRQA
jgi:hypothetical protein